jgi:hypothetical protein
MTPFSARFAVNFPSHLHATAINSAMAAQRDKTWVMSAVGGWALPLHGPVEIVEAFASFRERGFSFRGDILL